MKSCLEKRGADAAPKKGTNGCTTTISCSPPNIRTQRKVDQWGCHGTYHLGDSGHECRPGDYSVNLYTARMLVDKLLTWIHERPLNSTRQTGWGQLCRYESKHGKRKTDCSSPQMPDKRDTCTQSRGSRLDFGLSFCGTACCDDSDGNKGGIIWQSLAA